MRGRLCSSFLLLLFSLVSQAENAGADSPSMHDSELLPPPPQAASALQSVETDDARYAYMLPEDVGFDSQLNRDLVDSKGYPQAIDDELLQRIKQLVQREQKRLAWNRRSYAPMFVGKKSAPMFVGKKSAPFFVGKKSQGYYDSKRAAPFFVGKKSAPYFVGSRAAPFFVGKKAAPFFVGKRSAPYFVGKRAAPFFVGRRAAPFFVGKKSAPFFVGKKAAPFFVGKKAAPFFVGKKSAPMFIGKKSAPLFLGKKNAPLFLGKRPLEDILSNLESSNVKEQSVSPYYGVLSLDARPVDTVKSTLALPDYTENQVSKRYMYPAPYFVGKRSETPKLIGKRTEESFKDLLSALNYYEAARQYRRLVQAEKRFEAPLFVGRRSSPSSRFPFV